MVAHEAHTCVLIHKELRSGDAPARLAPLCLGVGPVLHVIQQRVPWEAEDALSSFSVSVFKTSQFPVILQRWPVTYFAAVNA